MTLKHVGGSAIGAALIGSVVLGACEQLAANIAAPPPPECGSWPAGLKIAAAGRIILTQLILWIPTYLLCGALYWLASRRRRNAAAEPFLLALFIPLALTIVVPSGLDMGNRNTPQFIIPIYSVGAGAVVAVYFGLRALRKWFGVKTFERLFIAAGAVALVAATGASAVFLRSPLYDPDSYKVPITNAKTTVSCEPPNVLWIVLDTVRADRLSLYGFEESTTPFLEELEKKAIVFNRAIANGMWTLPTHASMFTGLPARTHGMGQNIWKLDEKFDTVSKRLRDAGYATALFSNNALVAPRTNLSSGFEDIFVVREFQDAARFALGRLFENSGVEPPVPWLDYDGGAAVTNYLVDRWLDSAPETPLFVFINFMEAHLPYRTPRRWRELYMTPEQVDRSYELRRSVSGDIESRLNIDALISGYKDMTEFDREVVKRQYLAALSYLDYRLRETFDIFERRGALKNAIVVIVADHGEYLDTHGMWSHHVCTYQDLIHVPMMMMTPNVNEPRRIDSLVQLSDLYPTVLRAALGSDAAPISFAAHDLTELMPNSMLERTAISECFGADVEMQTRILARKDKALHNRVSPQISAQNQRYKYIRSSSGTRELYDLSDDPGELNDLSSTLPKIVSKFERYINRWLSSNTKYRPPAFDSDHRLQALESMRRLGYVDD